MARYDASLYTWHTKFAGGVKWRLSTNGIEIQGRGIERADKDMASVKRIWGLWKGAIRVAWEVSGVPEEITLACIATEANVNISHSDFVCTRHEPGYVSDEATPDKASYGVMQTLIATAQEMLPGVKMTRSWLSQPSNSILAGTRYIASKAGKTLYDAPLVGASYNAGGIYQNNGAKNRWKLKCYPIGTGDHIDRFVRFYNDAIAMQKTLAS